MESTNRWLLLVLQLPAHPSNARVKTWRRLQQLGAVPVKNAVYALPNSSQALEDFEWLRSEIEGLGGHATVFTAASVENVDEAEMIEQFRAARATDFKHLLDDIRRVKTPPRAGRDRAVLWLKELRALRDRLEHVKAIDFFAAPGAADAETALSAIELRAHPPRGGSAVAPSTRIDRRLYTRRTWLTRPRPGVDRFASAWFIQRFIDPDAQFAFGSSPDGVANAVPYDMHGIGFTHQGDRCTFEVLHTRFGIDDVVVRRIGEIVHDVDLKDDRFHSPQAPTIATLVEGLRASISDDADLLRHGIALFEALYRGLHSGQRAPRPSRKPRG